LSVLPATLQQFFRSAFVDGARNPEVRPPAQAWLAELVRLRTDAPALPAHHGLAIDPGAINRGVARPRAAPPTRSNPEMPSGTRHLDAPPPHRHRSKLRLAACAVTALVAIGGVLGVSIVAHRSAPVADPTASAETRTTSTPSLIPPDVQTVALEQIRTQDAPVVETLAESWVAQLSARPAGTQSADQAATDAAILAGHQQLRKQHPGAVLLRSTDWNYDGGLFWITVMNERFSTAEDANTWCDAHHFAPPDCFAKKLSHSGGVVGSARYRR
jgi:hypothetical protein